ncbi:FHA domain-containing protein [Synechococcales cyanobacterium C]|uniref:FHA domain-containing protein n=1 Tax=Petrachloros mirabilis ULC683 TaxID=2781853 RepID=A0A8K2A8J5_9CYAN|nr:FHA domain-containing protein [Petrachloros mirabilis]NCJ08104.1 FHA domain-containing protein [Petrachloros mirabilis ULC683]
MATSSAPIRLSWQDPSTGEQRLPHLSPPIALGREFTHMPVDWQGQRVSRIVLNSGQVSRFHALLTWENDQLRLQDQNSSNGTQVNGGRQTDCLLNHGDVLEIGPYRITLLLRDDTDLGANRVRGDSVILIADPIPEVAPVTSAFPPPFFQSRQVNIQALYATQYPVEEVDYGALGAGLGSFVWVDLLRLCGVSPQQVRVIGLEAQPYARYQRLCLNSQIPAHERLRSNSDSCPDNIWGWPGYALREAWHDFTQGQLRSVGYRLWQVFAEPTFAETYTPKSGRVFASIDREATRIGWPQMYRFGRIRAIRQTDDGRYAIAYALGRGQYAFLVARYIHLATGYPAIQFLPDLQDYRERTQDFQVVVNAYEAHDHVYQALERQGGTVLIRGRGIVASRILQRLYEARQRNPNIAVLHLMRSPKPKGNQFQYARRAVSNHFELQPFNWPKACWGGTLRSQLEQAGPEERMRLLADWGGTTTADRGDWQRIVQAGLDEGWYQVGFGTVTRVEPDAQGCPLTFIQEMGLKGEIKLEANFIIDATGLDGKVKTNPLLDELVTHYNLPLNLAGRLAVTNDFELVEMRNHKGRMYAAGAITFGGPYAAVDSFLGLQYAALCAVNSLAQGRAPQLRSLHGWHSLAQWCKWARNQTP